MSFSSESSSDFDSSSDYEFEEEEEEEEQLQLLEYESIKTLKQLYDSGHLEFPKLVPDPFDDFIIVYFIDAEQGKYLFFNANTGHIITPYRKPDDYVDLDARYRGKHHHRPIHQVVYETYYNVDVRKLYREDKLEINHVHQIRYDNRISELELVPRSLNASAKTSFRGVEQEYVEELPADAVVVSVYGVHILRPTYYASKSARKMYQKCGDHWYRVLKIDKRNCMKAKNTYNKQVAIYINKLMHMLD